MVWYLRDTYGSLYVTLREEPIDTCFPPSCVVYRYHGAVPLLTAYEASLLIKVLGAIYHYRRKHETSSKWSYDHKGTRHFPLYYC